MSFKLAPLNYGYLPVLNNKCCPNWLVKANEMDGMIVISELQSLVLLILFLQHKIKRPVKSSLPSD